MVYLEIILNWVFIELSFVQSACPAQISPICTLDLLPTSCNFEFGSYFSTTWTKSELEPPAVTPLARVAAMKAA